MAYFEAFDLSAEIFNYLGYKKESFDQQIYGTSTHLICAFGFAKIGCVLTADHILYIEN